MKRILWLLAALLLLGAGHAWAEGLSGTYALKQGTATLTLVIKQGPTGQLTGQLDSSSGASFALRGNAKDDFGQGSLRGATGWSYFQARRQGSQLLLALVEPDANGRPNLDRVRRLVLQHQGTSRGQPQPSGGSALTLPSGGNKELQPGPTPAPRPDATGQARSNTRAAGPAAPAGGEVGHALWGFAFKPPPGWKQRMLARGVLLGHDQIAGFILVVPHLHDSMAEVQAQMVKGVSEGNTRMGLSGQLRRMGPNALAGDYQGFWEGQPAKGQGIGTLSPFGGGALVIAVSAPQKFRGQLTNAAAQIASGLRYFKVDDSALVKHFAGYWWRYSGTSQLSRESIIHLAPDGTYRDRHETAANVTNKDAQGHVTSQYLGHSDKRRRGTWKVRGTKAQGIIFITRKNGTTTEIEYQVKPSQPQKYGSYYFNGQIHHWITPKQLRELGY